MQIGQAQGATTPNIPPVVNMNRLLVEIGLAKSHSEAGRLIAQGAVEIDGKKVTSNVVRVEDIFIIKVGKRRFAKVINIDASSAQ
jgi:tyrosyl-tRNA synthetase